MRFGTNAAFGFVIDFVLFGEHPDISEPSITQPNSQKLTMSEKYKGEFAHLSIKHQLRHEIAEDLQSIGIVDAVGIEVDQTGMELHERCACVSGQLVWLRLAFFLWVARCCFFNNTPIECFMAIHSLLFWGLGFRA